MTKLEKKEQLSRIASDIRRREKKLVELDAFIDSQSVFTDNPTKQNLIDLAQAEKERTRSEIKELENEQSTVKSLETFR